MMGLVKAIAAILIFPMMMGGAFPNLSIDTQAICMAIILCGFIAHKED